MIKPQTVQQIIETARVEEVVGEFVSLKKRGVNLLGLCPFHNEKTPSFTVSPGKGIFKCFGCGKAGNSVGFVMEHEHLSYPDALRYLARKYNIEIEEKKQTPEELAAMNERESLLHVTEFAANFFFKTLTETEEGKNVGLSYFHERGLRFDTIENFQLGYSPQSYDGFTNAALKAGYKIEYLEKSGLTLVRDGRNIDRFRGRVIFPIQTQSGRVIGFGGRILGANKKLAKYVNSPESEIYNKSKTLYGIWHARNEIVRHDRCFLVEGYTDVISLHQAGIKNVVASSGTSLTHEQIRLIKRYTPNITILYDGDSAGIKASFRGIDLILEEGMNVYVVLFPEGEDPDSYARSHRSDEVEKFLNEKAETFINFKSNVLIADAAGDPVKMASLIREIVGSISLIPEPITRTLFIRECSTMMNIDEQTLMAEMNKKRRENLKNHHKTMGRQESEAIVPVSISPPQQKEQSVEKSRKDCEREIARLLILYGDMEFTLKEYDEDNVRTDHQIPVAPFIISELNEDDTTFEEPVYQEILLAFIRGVAEEKLPKKEFFVNNPDPTFVTAIVDLIQEPYALSDVWEKKHIDIPTEEKKLKEAVFHALFSLKYYIIDKEMEIVDKEIKEASSPEEAIESLTIYQVLQQQRKMIADELTRTVVK